MDGLARKYWGKMLTRTEMTSNTPVNFSELAEHMLNPHHGQHNGPIRPDHWCQGSEGACDCIKVPNEVEASNIVDRAPEVVAQPNQGGTEDNMEKAVELDLEDMPGGTVPQVSKFHKYANTVTMVALVKGDYSEELLSNRLKGRVIKEGLAITLLMQFREENPSPTAKPPHLIPRELLSNGQEVLQERLSFLAVISKKPTARERRLKVNIEKHPSIKRGKSKRKLTMTPSEDLAEGPPPCKKQKVFSN
jgi:hypothetical protein